MDAVASFFKDVGLTFVPIFVAMDAIGVLPFILSLTQDMSPVERTRTVRYALLTALLLGLGFIGIGLGVFRLLDIWIEDFLIAGGLILLVLAIRHLMTGKMVEVQPALGEQMIAVVPIGTPLVVGPAVLTTLLLLIDRDYSIGVVVVSFLLNLALAWLIFSQANRIVSFLRQGGVRALSQIVSLLLAAIAVEMMRQGIMGILGM
jgi:multiple antibiotic resistance protein